MTTNISRMRARLQQRQQAKAKAEHGAEKPMQVIHGHDGRLLYLTLQPAPVNGMVSFTEDQYVSALEKMAETLAQYRYHKQKGGDN